MFRCNNNYASFSFFLCPHGSWNEEISMHMVDTHTLDALLH